MLPAKRFLGSGHQTKETEIEANFLWQAATTPMPRRHVLQKGLGKLVQEDTGYLPLSTLLLHKQL